MFQKMGGGEMGHGSEKPRGVEYTDEVEPKEESAEVHHEGMLGHVMESIRRAPQNAIVLVSGLDDRDYAESMAALANEKDITLIDKRSGETIGSTRTSLDEQISSHPNEKIVANIPALLQNAFSDSGGGMDNEEIERLFKPSHDPMGELLEWIKKQEEASGEAREEDALMQRFEKVFEMIRLLSGGSDRPIQLTLPAASPLVLAYLTFARYGTLSYTSIRNMREEYPVDDHDAVASIVLESHTRPRVFFGDREID
jgi:hypothetical protein